MIENETATPAENVDNVTNFVENETLEQPQNENISQTAAAEKKEEGECDSTLMGSKNNFGKFESKEALLKAYAALESEFTKKCQKLSELGKKQEESENAEKKSQAPQFTLENWEEKVASFLEKNQNAKEYSSEISAEILNNPEKYSGENSLDLAWANVALKRYVNPKTVHENNEFLNEHIFSNSDVKNKIVEICMKEIRNSSSPVLIGSATGGTASLGSHSTPTTLAEAKKMALNMMS